MFDYVTKYDESITISTDGSADEEKIPFGWKICKKQGNSFTSHASPVFGFKSSFKAKAYGILPVLCYLKR